MPKKISFLVCILCISVSLFAQQPGTAQKGTVVNGVPAGNGYPFFCSLTAPVGTSPANFMPRCGATLIAPDWVLTAGHCVVNMAAGYRVLDSIDVVVAPSIIPAPGTNTVRLRSDYIVKHQLFNLATGITDDIALIHLRTPVQVTPVRLPAQGDNSMSVPGADVKVIGFGTTDTAVSHIPDTLQMAQIKVIDNNICNEPARYWGAVESGMICAGLLTGLPTGSGVGDSGGPLFVESGSVPVQIGIVSFGAKAYSDTTHPGVYTRVSAYRNWIDSVINHYKQSTGIPQASKLETKIMAQSGHLSLGFSMALPSDAACALYDMTGKVIVQSAIKSQLTQFDMPLPGIAPGIYVLKLVLKTGETYQHKLCLQ